MTEVNLLLYLNFFCSVTSDEEDSGCVWNFQFWVFQEDQGKAWVRGIGSKYGNSLIILLYVLSISF